MSFVAKGKLMHTGVVLELTHSIKYQCCGLSEIVEGGWQEELLVVARAKPCCHSPEIRNKEICWLQEDTDCLLTCQSFS